MTPADVIRAAMPSATDHDCEHILWGRTAFPFEKLTAQKLYKAASAAVRAHRNGLVLCDHCERVANPDQYTCDRCAAALGRRRR